MKKSFIFLALPLAFIVATSTGCATTSKREKAAQRFAERDLDGDGRLSYSEFLKAPMASRAKDPKAAFNAIDTDRDGYLSKQELVAKARQYRAQME